MLPPSKTQSDRLRSCGGFTLVELLAVMGVIVLMIGFVVPAVIAIKGGGDVTKAAYDVSGALETARAYAKANSTYVWVGFFEEDESLAAASPAVAGPGRVTLSIAASKDGTPIYNPSLVAATNMSPSGLVQVGKLIRLDNMHLATFADGTGTGTTFLLRPPLNDSGSTAHIGAGSPASPSLTTFSYPVTAASAATAQYTFVKAIEFSPRGEARVDNASYGYQPLIEIGLQPTHGKAIDTSNKNLVAIQVAGIVGSVTIYRQ